VVDQIVDRTDGVPLFLEELTKAVLEDANLSTVPAISLKVPATLHASLIARLDRLGTTAAEIAKIGAAIGRDFSYQLLAISAQRTEAELSDALSRLIDAGLVLQSGVLPQATFRFKHALVQDTAYSMLLRRPRQALHAQIARVIEQHFPIVADTQPEILAHHFTEAGLLELAVAYWYRAGKLSVAKSALAEAITQLKAGLRLILDLPDAGERKQQELELQITLADALMVTKGYAYPEVAEASRRARSLIFETGGAGTIIHFSALRGLWAADFHSGKPRSALEHANELLSLAQSWRDTRLLAAGHWFVGRVLITIGDYPSAISHLWRAVASYRAEKHCTFDSTIGADIGVTALVTWGLAVWHRGYPDQARKAADEALRRARRLGDLRTRAYALLMTGLIAIWSRQTTEAEELANELIAVSREHRCELLLGFGQIFRGWALAQHGDSGAVERIREGLRVAQATGWRCHEPGLLGLLAEALALSSAIGEGLEVLAEALATAEGSGARGNDAELQRLQGELLRRLPSPDWTEVEGCFRTALAVAREQGTRGFELRAAVSLGRLLDHQSRRNEARDLLAPICGWFTEGGDTPDLIEAKALLKAFDNVAESSSLSAPQLGRPLAGERMTASPSEAAAHRGAA